MGCTIASRLVSKYIFGADIDVNSSFTPQHEEPDLTNIGKNVFAANGVQLRNISFYPGGLVQFGAIEIGDATMILDRSVIGPGTCIPSEVLVGSITAVTKETEYSSRSLLMGVPALRLVRVENGNQEAKQITSEPLSQSLLLYLCGIYFSIIISGLVSAAIYSNALIYWFFNMNHPKYIVFGITFVALPACLVSLVALLLLLCYVIKRLLIGNYKRLQLRCDKK